jgi:hypothetical protein
MLYVSVSPRLDRSEYFRNTRGPHKLVKNERGNSLDLRRMVIVHDLYRHRLIARFIQFVGAAFLSIKVNVTVASNRLRARKCTFLWMVEQG